LPFAMAGDTRLFYRLEGEAGKPLLVLSHSIGTDLGMWEPQIADLLPHFQILRYDTRGHGASDAPKGDYSVELLGKDLLRLCDTLGIAKFALCGLSMGGAIGLWIAAHAAERLTALVLANTSPQFGPAANWDTRIRRVQEGGMAAIVEMATGRFFSAETLARGNPYAHSIRSVLLGTDPGGYVGCCTALRDVNHTPLLRQIRVPTLVIVGDRDVSTPWSGHGEILARDISGAQVLHLPAAHLSNVERPRSFSLALLDFLKPEGEPASDPTEAGFRTRRAVLGDAHVDRAIASTTALTRDFQAMITRYAWGTIWARPGLDHRTRRLLVLAMTAALGRWEEFNLHLRAGLAHELEPCDVKELLLQVAIYAGVPASNTAFHMAQEEIEKPKDT
jgi:3-oxoadipate enol-lactonase / 4-carboxymuconolactone decarboxylase